MLEDQFFIQPRDFTIPSKILQNGGRFYPYFHDGIKVHLYQFFHVILTVMIGAINATHIHVKISK